MAKVKTNKERLNQLFDMDPRNDSAIADSLDVSKQTISAWRNGTRSPKGSMLEEIALKYGTSVSWLMGWDLPDPDIDTAPILLKEDEKAVLLAYRSAENGIKMAVRKLLDIE